MSQLIVTTLSRTIFLVKILTSSFQQTNTSTNNDYHFMDSNLLALELALKMMCIPRGPAATKTLEVLCFYLVSFIL